VPTIAPILFGQTQKKVSYIEAVNKFLLTDYNQPSAWKNGFPAPNNRRGACKNGACILYTLRHLQEFGNIRYVSDLTYPVLQDFINSRSTIYTNKTLNKYRNRIRKFLHFCYKMDWVIKNEADKLDRLKETTPDRYSFSRAEVDTVLSSDETTEYHLFFELMLETGLRACDAWELTQGNFPIDPEDGSKYLRVKMKKNDRVLEVPISERAQKIVADLDTVLFPWAQNVWNRDKALIALKYAFGRADNAGHKFCKKFGINLHVWRHTFAQWKLDSGVRKEVIQQLLGHTSVTTTEIYANTRNKADLKPYV
jgi:integrase/recombinase XerD